MFYLRLFPSGVAAGNDALEQTANAKAQNRRIVKIFIIAPRAATLMSSVVDLAMT